jgi:hypothetical protein
VGQRGHGMCVCVCVCVYIYIYIYILFYGTGDESYQLGTGFFVYHSC